MMITIFNSLKQCYGPIRAIKNSLKLLFAGVFIIFGLFMVNQAVLGSYDDFESYDLGNIIGQDNWQGIGTPSVVTTQASSGVQSLFFNQCGGAEYVTKVLDLGYQPDEFSYWYYPHAFSSRIPYWELTDSENNLLFNQTLGGGGLTENVWHYWKVEIDNENHLFREINEATTSDWIAWSTTTDIYKIKIFGIGAVNCDCYIDDLDFNPDCDSFETYYTCQNAGCCWYYSSWLYESFCVDCPIGECETGPLTCQNCNSTSTCEAEDYCYWFDNTCRYGTGECGEGLELQFCENQTDCENAGGYWYSNFCWLSPEVSITSWDDYYSEYGDYATPSAWISNMASTTSLFFGQIGGFLSVFEGNFDLMEAFEKGQNFGEVIPTARGYLVIFDDFLGGFPISEFFVFLLIFMLAVGVFRIMRNLFQMIKFW